jgi:DNA-binding MarR family transcriptional regulator
MKAGSTRRSNSNKWRETYSHDPAQMQRLRGAGWVKASALPSSPGLVQKLLQKGWIETKSGPKTEVLYRLTEDSKKRRFPEQRN